MKLMKLEDLAAHKSMADEFQSNIKDSYETAMKYCLPTRDFSSTSFADLEKANEVYDTIGFVESNKLARKLVNMILPTSIQWGGLTKNGVEDKKTKGILDRYGEITYKNIITSNLNKEALSFFGDLNIGTAIMKLSYSGSNKNPFKFENLPISGLKFTENEDKEPEIVFYEHYGVPSQFITEKFDISEDKVKKNSRIDYTEIAYSYYEGENREKKKYHYIICDNNLTNIYFENDDMGYMPLIVCRNEKQSNSIFGTGPAIQALPNLVNNNDSKYNIKVATRQKLKPPTMFEGSLDTFKDFSISLGKTTYLGQPGQNRITPFNYGADIQPELLSADFDRTAIKEIFLSSYITSDMNSGNPKTKFEWQQRYREFMEVFSPNYEMIETEFLKPVFENCLNILCLEKIEDMSFQELEKLDYKPKFKNKLTENFNSEKIQNFNEFIMNLGQIIGNPQLVLSTMDAGKVFEKYSIWYDIDQSLMKSQEEINKFIAEYQATLQQQQQVEAMPNQNQVM